MKKALILVLAALVVPSAAIAATPAVHGKSAPKVLYVLKGKLSAYTAYTPATSTTAAVNGSITIMVSSANYHGKGLKGQTLTFAVDGKTKITLQSGVTKITDGDKGIVKIRAAKRVAAADLATTLQAAMARQVIDQVKPAS